MNQHKDIKEKIDHIIKTNDVVVFMKGDAYEPQCGFSFTVVRILDYLGVNFCDINVLTDQEMREAIKDYTNWPTIPQVYIKGEFIGGCDIVKQMFDNQELQSLLTQHKINFKNCNS